MKEIKFELTEEHIPLIKLLKFLRLVESGGMAKMVVEDGLVSLNGEVEFRKRVKLIEGDIIEFGDVKVTITKS